MSQQKFFVCISLLAIISLVVMFKQLEILARVRGEERTEMKRGSYAGRGVRHGRREDGYDAEEGKKGLSRVIAHGDQPNRIQRGQSSLARHYSTFRNPETSTTKTPVLPSSHSTLRASSHLKPQLSSSLKYVVSSSSLLATPLGASSSLMPSIVSSMRYGLSSLTTSATLSASSSSAYSVAPSSSPTATMTSSSSRAALRTLWPACPYEGLNGSERFYESSMSCVPHPRNERYCNEAFAYFGNYSLESCDKTSSTGDLCAVHTEYRLGPTDLVDVKCSRNICERAFPVFLGCPDPNYGILRGPSEWLKFPSIRKLELELPSIVVNSTTHGFNFCFVKCTRNGSEITQSLIFPPLIKRRSKDFPDSGKINVNILLEDSISRMQFYRYLPQTVEAFRTIATKQGATVLDFELVQSYASFTVPNVQHLMAGTKYHGSRSRHNGIEVLTQKFKRLGYQTLLHEDLCWFDFWGSFLSPTYKKLEYFTKEFKREYLKYLHSTVPHIDNAGLTAFSCEVLRSLGHTNPFRGDRLPKICWNGRFHSDYILTFVRDFLSAIEGNPGVAAPALVYTHLDTAHERTGMRVRNDDGVLARFVTDMAQRQNTLTIVLSDHGAKTNDYAIKSLAGSMEIYNPVLFMVVPLGVARKLGRRRMDALRTNQRRLVSLLDLHRMVTSLGDLSVDPHDHLVSGLLAPVPLNRTCESVEGLKPDALCLCQGWHEWLSSSSLVVVWLAEFALGELNNRIQKQFSASTTGQRRGRGYGACARFAGKRVERARRELAGNDYAVTMVLVVLPEFTAGPAERFEVHLRYAPAREHNITFVKFTRLSFYSKFESCRDDGVDVKLCACSEHRPLKPLNIKKLIKRESFKRETAVQVLDSQSCLFLATRKLDTKLLSGTQARVLAFEVANVCEHVEFTINVEGVYKLARISRTVPFSLRLKPASVHFLFSVLNDWKFGRFRPVVTVEKSERYPGKMTLRAPNSPPWTQKAGPTGKAWLAAGYSDGMSRSKTVEREDSFGSLLIGSDPQPKLRSETRRNGWKQIAQVKDWGPGNWGGRARSK